MPYGFSVASARPSVIPEWTELLEYKKKVIVKRVSITMVYRAFWNDVKVQQILFRSRVTV